MTAPTDKPKAEPDAEPASTPPSRPRSASEKGTGHGDGVLDSLGKAISAPVIGAAEPEEPDERGAPPVKPGG